MGGFDWIIFSIDGWILVTIHILLSMYVCVYYYLCVIIHVCMYYYITISMLFSMYVLQFICYYPCMIYDRMR